MRWARLKARRPDRLKLLCSPPIIDHRTFIYRYGDDMPEISGWRWGQEAGAAGVHSTEADNV